MMGTADRYLQWPEFGAEHYRPPRTGRLPRYAPRPIEWERPSVRALALRDGWTCAYCGCPVEEKASWRDDPTVEQATIDHVVPQIRGGGDTCFNTVLACRPCNTSKGERHPSVMFA